MIVVDKKDRGKQCQFCQTDFDTFNNKLRHYYDCKKFNAEFLKLDSAKRSKYMILIFVCKNPQYAHLICIGCGTIEKSATALCKHRDGCSEAAAIDELNRKSLYGYFPYEGVILTEPIKSQNHKEAHIIRTLRNYVQNIRNRMENAKKGPKESVKSVVAESKDEHCRCANCANAHNLPPTSIDANIENYMTIPIMINGYSTVMNGRDIYVPTQHVYIRVHDRGFAKLVRPTNQNK